MSDRIAVMAHGRVEQLGAPGGDLPAAGDPLRGRLHRRGEPPPGRHRGVRTVGRAGAPGRGDTQRAGRRGVGRRGDPRRPARGDPDPPRGARVAPRRRARGRGPAVGLPRRRRGVRGRHRGRRRGGDRRASWPDGLLPAGARVWLTFSPDRLAVLPADLRRRPHDGARWLAVASACRRGSTATRRSPRRSPASRPPASTASSSRASPAAGSPRSFAAGSGDHGLAPVALTASCWVTTERDLAHPDARVRAVAVDYVGAASGSRRRSARRSSRCSPRASRVSRRSRPARRSGRGPWPACRPPPARRSGSACGSRSSP